MSSHSPPAGGRDPQQRAHSPPPDAGDKSRYEIKYAEPQVAYAEPKFGYAPPPQAPEPPSETPYPPFKHTAHPQFEARPPPSPGPGPGPGPAAGPGPGPQPGYAQPGHYQHSHVNPVAYADPHQYSQWAHPPPSEAGFAAGGAPQPEYARGGPPPPSDHPQYTSPAPYQYTAPGDDRAAAAIHSPVPLSPAAGHARTPSFGARPTSPYHAKLSGAGSLPPAGPSYATPSFYSYAQPGVPVTSSPAAAADPARSHPAAQAPAHRPQLPNAAKPEYARPAEYRYAHPDDKIKYSYVAPKPRPPEEPRPRPAERAEYDRKTVEAPPPRRVEERAEPRDYKGKTVAVEPKREHRAERHHDNDDYFDDDDDDDDDDEDRETHPKRKSTNVVEIKPGAKGADPGRPPASPRPSGLSAHGHRVSLSVGTGAHSPTASPGGRLPPGSPLLESYRGTYQSISPMPSPMLLGAPLDDDLDDLSPLSGQGSSAEDYDDDDDEYYDDGHHRQAPGQQAQYTIKRIAYKESERGREHGRDRERSQDRRLDVERDRSRNRERDRSKNRERDRSKIRERDRSRDGRNNDKQLQLYQDNAPKRAASPKRKKRVTFYDPESDARRLAETLRHRAVDPEPLIQILPRLTHDQVMQLREEYKKQAKVQGKGINVAKHIKMKLCSGSNVGVAGTTTSAAGTGGPAAFGKICYVTALGRWESEAYWANFWYQNAGSRRELLIEALMGRSNAEVRQIKQAFRDKRYHDSLERCMRAELKADKFRTAVLLALEERRQEESQFVYADAVRDDVRRLHDAVVARAGGETAMIQIVVTRSDTHMREVLRNYDRTYGKSFPREMLKKSTNLVGETLAHILNGIINRPVRDALLIHQALILEQQALTGGGASGSGSSPAAAAASSPLTARETRERTELLISRLVRYHWDRAHLEAIKTEFRARYGAELVTAVARATRGDFGEFCTEMCLRRR